VIIHSELVEGRFVTPETRKKETMNTYDIQHVIGNLTREITIHREMVQVGGNQFDMGVLCGLEMALEVLQSGIRLRNKFHAERPE
jgi:hypothetical protein